MHQINSLSKGQTLVYLSDKIKLCKVPKTKVFQVRNWKENKRSIIVQIKQFFKKEKFLAIRRSAINEDGIKYSLAGKYYSELFVKNLRAFSPA